MQLGRVEPDPTKRSVGLGIRLFFRLGRVKGAGGEGVGVLGLKNVNRN